MTNVFDEFVVGGILIAPIVSYALVALILILAVRPVLHLAGFSRLFSNPAIAELSLYVSILGLVTLLF